MPSTLPLLYPGLPSSPLTLILIEVAHSLPFILYPYLPLSVLYVLYPVLPESQLPTKSSSLPTSLPTRAV